MALRPRRETQQQKVYDSENSVGLWGTACGSTQAEVQAYVDKLCSFQWFRRRWGSQHFTVNTQRGLGGHGGWHVVHVGLNTTGIQGYEKGAQRNVVLHEMAHTLAQGRQDSGDWHGPHFARTMVELVRYAIGAEKARELLASYRKHRVKVAPPTPLKPIETTPAARPLPRTYRLQIGTEQFVFETTSIADVIDIISGTYTKYRPLLKEATEIRIWKSRATAVAKAATRPVRRKKA